jgi:hypothetical protein
MRLWKYKLFWLEMAAMISWGILVLFLTQDETTTGALDSIFFRQADIIGIFCAVFIGLFLGTDYSDGTLKNKIVVGHSKTSIYLSNFIVGLVEGLFLNLAWWITILAIGIPFFGGYLQHPGKILVYLPMILLLTALYVAIFTILCMLNQNKAGASVILILVFLLQLIVGTRCMIILQEPELSSTGPAVSIVEADGSITTNTTLEPNPAYVTGAERTFYEIACEVLPTAQGIQLAMMWDVNFVRISAFSLLIIAGTTVLGITCFRRKDIK